MHCVEPTITLVAHSQIRPDAVRDWLDSVGAKDYTVPDGTDAEQLVTLAGKRCYMSFEPGLNPNVTRVRRDTVAFLENILKSRHGSVLEHVTFTFAIENVSRVFTAELNRHRAGWAISEGSMRYIRFTDIPVWMPHSLRESEEDTSEILAKKAQSRQVFCQAFEQMESNYHALCDIWGLDSMTSFTQKKHLTSMMRRIMGMGVATGGVWTGNLRALRHVLAVRMAPEAEEEIAYVFTKIFCIMREQEPAFFGDFAKDADGIWRPDYWKV